MLIKLGLHPNFHAEFSRVAKELTTPAIFLFLVWLTHMSDSFRGIEGYEPLHTAWETFSIVVSGLILQPSGIPLEVGKIAP
jgi:hypothetical protein